MINSLGVIVRPNVTPPDIRPPRIPIKIETEEDDDVEIIGRTGQCIDLAQSESVRVTFTDNQAEQFRVFDTVRITDPRRVPANLRTWPKNSEPTGLRNYVDIEQTTYLQYRNEFGLLIVERFRKPEHQPSNGIFVIRENTKRACPDEKRG